MTTKEIESEAALIVGCPVRYTSESKRTYWFKAETFKVGIPKKKIKDYFELKQKEKK